MPGHCSNDFMVRNDGPVKRWPISRARYSPHAFGITRLTMWTARAGFTQRNRAALIDFLHIDGKKHSDASMVEEAAKRLT